MIINSFERDRALLENEYKFTVWNSDADGLIEKCNGIKNSEKDILSAKSDIISLILRSAEVKAEPYSLFADKIRHENITENFKLNCKRAADCNEMKGIIGSFKPLTDARVFTGDVDFGHTCPDWKFILDNGIVGILDKLNTKLSRLTPDDEKYSFYFNSKKVYEAALVYISRLADDAERQGGENAALVAHSLRTLTQSKPKTLHEAMQMIFIWYMLQQSLDAVYIRSLGGLDALLYPYYKNDIDSGRITEYDARIMVKYFLIKMGAKHAIANIPFYLCGSDENGTDLTNTLTHIILDEYIALDIEDPKIHIRCHKNIDKKVIMKVLESIRAGKNSFVFMNDDIVEKSLIKMGISEKDAHKYTIVGCYEPSAYGEIPCTCAGRINIPQILMLTMTNGIDLLSGNRLIPEYDKNPKSFEEFTERFCKNIEKISHCCMELITEYERNYMNICPSPFFSASMPESLEKGIDIYAGGAKYNNTSVCAFGLATAVDSLMAIKRAVYEEKLVTLSEFCDVLANNWEGNENLRTKMLNQYPKYGNGEKDTDLLASDIVKLLSEKINLKPNGRGGKFRFGLFSIDWRFWFGETTPATPDGRMARETISKNLSATLGCDKNGVTALINSVTKIDHTLIPNGAVLDIILHESAVNGDDGLISLYGLLSAYLKKGGEAIQFNILSPLVLRAAQAEPEKHKTLQVRLCGWNVHFVDLSRKEQDEFICQAEQMGIQS